ncbi:hypothetical protein PG996_010562 [Apiospora saccharicola]|uniref:Uncharacterized protein n=1 Tax=Apiospora saccharicola TaxID=335842 RepID=A0ABR1UNY1_9PEZI
MGIDDKLTSIADNTKDVAPNENKMVLDTILTFRCLEKSGHGRELSKASSYGIDRTPLPRSSERRDRHVAAGVDSYAGHDPEITERWDELVPSSSHSPETWQPFVSLPIIRSSRIRPLCSNTFPSDNAFQRTVIRLPDCNVLVVKGFLRSSYTNVLLIASRSRLKRVPYYKSARQMAFNETHATPFPMCAQLPVHFGGANAHCKCAERDARCSVRDQMYAGVE